MTGKASEIFNQVHFESGTLKSYQIDPFGANVAYDESNNRFYFKSQQETQDDARQAATFAKFQKYSAMLDNLRPDSPFRDEFIALSIQALRGLGESHVSSYDLRYGQRVDTLIREAKDAVVAADAAAVNAQKAADPKSAAQAEDRLQKVIDDKLKPNAPEVQATLDVLGAQGLYVLTKASELAKQSVEDATAAVTQGKEKNDAAQTKLSKENPQTDGTKQEAAASSEALAKAQTQLTIATTSAQIATDKHNQLVMLILAATTDKCKRSMNSRLSGCQSAG